MTTITCPSRDADMSHCWHQIEREVMAVAASGPPDAVVITKRCCWCGKMQKEMPIYGPDPMHGTKVSVWVPTGKVDVIG